MARLGVRMGANPMTFAGLAGVGDLILTCTGDLSRNRMVGYQIGQGRKLKDILADMNSVAEGVKNAVTVYKLAQKMEVSMPIIEQIYLVLYAEKSLKMAVHDLMTRRLKSEIGL
jgi:glycerol-3-phosphate dehydrogenase (NAD(P)+)